MRYNTKKSILFGGSFDPPHKGHKQIVKKLLEFDDIEQIIVLPAYLNPFKTKSFASAGERLDMCKRVFDIPNVIVSDYEISQNRSVYTYQSWSTLKKRYNLTGLTVGADNLSSITKWYNFDKLNSEAVWFVATRRGYPTDTSMLKRAKIVEIDIPISSTELRENLNLEYIDDTIRNKIVNIYNKDKN